MGEDATDALRDRRFVITTTNGAMLERLAGEGRP
jgi:hypothetical protein